MRLKAIVLENFRAYKGTVAIPIGNITTLIGRNDIGKSSILEAIGIFLESGDLKADFNDFCVHAEGHDMRIGCIFDDLPEQLVLDTSASTNLGAEYLLNANGDLEVHRSWHCEDGKMKETGRFAVAAHPSAQHYGDLLLLKNTDLKKRLRDQGVSSDGVNLSSNPSLRHALWSACTDLQVQGSQIPLNKDNTKEIWEQLSKVLPHFALFRADRPSTDQDEEAQGPMSAAVKEAVSEFRVELEQIKLAIEAKVLGVAKATLGKLKEFDSSLAERLAPQFKQEPKWDSIFKLSLNGDDNIPLNKRGSGFRRLVLMSFFLAEAERRQALGSVPDIIYAIEEPEASQHPDNQRMLIRALTELAQSPHTQVLVTTHVPGLAELLPIESLRYVGIEEVNTTTVETSGEAMINRVANALGVLPDRRVKVLVYVEGPHDVVALRKYSALLREHDGTLPDLSNDRRIAILPVGGNTLRDWIDKRYLTNLSLPEVHIYDSGSNTPPTYQTQVDEVNARADGSQAFLTSKREMENYLHPMAVQSATGHDLVLTRTCDVPEMLAEAFHVASGVGTAWTTLTPEVKKSKESAAKKWLNGKALEGMTLNLVQQGGDVAEIESWMTAIGRPLN